MKIKTLIGLIVVLILFGIVKLYIKDASTVEEAIIVNEYLIDYCKAQNSYPELEKLIIQFPELYPNQDWYYWPNETMTMASFQYPMSLPLPSAIGHSKVSEFFPVIYSYVVKHPCKNLIQETSSPVQ